MIDVGSLYDAILDNYEAKITSYCDKKILHLAIERNRISSIKIALDRINFHPELSFQERITLFTLLEEPWQ